MKAKYQISEQILSIVLCFVLMLGLVPFSSLMAYAADGNTCVVTDCNGTYIGGVCANCKGNQPATLVTNENCDVLGLSADHVGYHAVGNEGQLLWFVAQVNGGQSGINAILTDNIDLTGIASWQKMEIYNGTFDGAGYSIIGLNKDAGIADDNRNGFIKTLNGTVKNVIFDSANVFHQSDVGAGIIAYNNAGTIFGCMVVNSEMQLGNYAGLGFIAGKNFEGGVIKNCGAVNSKMTRRYSGSGSQTMGGITQSNDGTVEHCYTYNCTFGNGTSANGALIASGNAPVNSYYYTTDTTVTTYGTAKSSDAFASGEVAWLLNGETSEGELVWKQTIGTHAYPVFEGETVRYGEAARLTGTVTITGDTLVGSTLTATVTDTNNTGELKYQWYRNIENDVVIPGATESSYTLTDEDLYYAIYCEVTSSIETDSIIGRASGIVSKVYHITFKHPSFDYEFPVKHGMSFNEAYPDAMEDMDAAKDYHTFIGWYESTNGGETFKDTPYDFSAKVTDDVTLYPLFKINTYTVTFMDENGVYKTLTVKYGEKVEMPETPTKDGYTVRWEKVLDTVTGDVTVRAVYTENPKTEMPESPQTGDNINMAIWVALLFISGGAVVTLIVYDRKRRKVANSK